MKVNRCPLCRAPAIVNWRSVDEACWSQLLYKQPYRRDHIDVVVIFAKPHDIRVKPQVIRVTVSTYIYMTVSTYDRKEVTITHTSEEQDWIYTLLCSWSYIQ
jgi:hypothetical protein